MKTKKEIQKKLEDARTWLKILENSKHGTFRDKNVAMEKIYVLEWVLSID
jgi:hypothetical protein